MTVVVTHTTPADGTFSATGAAAWNANHTLSGVGTLAEQNANAVAITGGTIDNTPIGGTTPAAGTFTTLTATGTSNFGTGSANYFEFAGAATTNAVEAKALGSDTNIAFVIDSKGTGAIDLAAGSRGVNISNGGTVTAITRTAIGSYTSQPSCAISAPTTAGGVTATGTAIMYADQGTTVAAGGTGYTVGDTLTLVGGTPTSSAGTFTVATVSGGVVLTVNAGNFANYSALPSSPVATTGGTGTGCTLTVLWKMNSVTVTNAGSGYVEQPTVTFSGGGGSGAAAYATVGSATVIRSLHRQMSVNTAGGETVRITDLGGLNDAFVSLSGSQFQRAYIGADGSATNVALQIGGTKGTGQIVFATGPLGTEQFRVANTASAVNYVQVTGAATGGAPTISSQGSDANPRLVLNAKGSSSGIDLLMNGSRQVFIGTNGSAVNYLQIGGTAAGVSPSVAVAGTDANIDLALTPKGTGNVRFGTFTADMALVVQGYIEIKDSGGTVRKLAVIA
jgi:hypothetical protein